MVLRCECGKSLTVEGFIEHGPPSPIRIVFDFYCISCGLRCPKNKEPFQQLPWTRGLYVEYDEYYYASSYVRNWMKRHDKTTIIEVSHPLRTARLVRQNE